VERLPRGEGEAVPVNRIEPRIVPHEPDPDLLADAQRLRDVEREVALLTDTRRR
jgi:hypothetical protein